MTTIRSILHQIGRWVGPCTGILGTACLLSTPARSADVITHPAKIRGGIHFSTHNEAIRSIVTGTRNLHCFAASAPPAPALRAESDRDFDPGMTDFNYEVVVEGAPAGAADGYVYELSYRMLIPGQQYWTKGLVTGPVHEGDTVSTSATHCPALLDVRFVDRPGGSPIHVDAANYFVSAEGVMHALAYNIPGEGHQMLVWSGVPLNLQVGYSRGTDPTVDRLTYYTSVSIPVPIPCDEVRRVEIVVPAAGALGRIVGDVDMREVDEIPNDGASYALNTIMVADGPPYGGSYADSDRYTFLNRFPSSGRFELGSLLPSDYFVPTFGSGGYRVYGRMQFRHGRAVNSFRTPSLQGASGPNVPAGGVVDLGGTFVMQPGYVSGHVTLHGASEACGRSALRHVWRLTDSSTPAGDPIGGAWTMGLYSSIEATGVNRVAPGATETAYEGIAHTEFSGDYNPATEELDGKYELVLGGLKSQASIWDLSVLNLAFNSLGSGDPLVLGNLRIQDIGSTETVIEPGSHQVRDRRYCFGQLELVFNSPMGAPIFQPSVAVQGSFEGTDLWGNPAHYEVATGAGQYLGTSVPVPFLGEPFTPESAALDGVVRLTLPQGTYTLIPSVKMRLNDGTIGDFSLPPLTGITVGCGDCSRIPMCLSIQVPPMPDCLHSPAMRIEGSVESCTRVTRLTWTAGDNVEHVICENCGISPAFSFDLPVSNRCEDQTFTILAYDAQNRQARLTRTLRADRIAPTITTPDPILVKCTGPDGATVPYSAGAYDSCGLDTFTCLPAPGSRFPIGTTWVRCVARDLCGNETTRSFPVTVEGDCRADDGCSTNLLVNGSFESPGIPDGYVVLAAGDPILTGWSPVLNGIEYFNPIGATRDVSSGAAADGHYVVDLATPQGSGGGIQQTFATIPGNTYQVRFALGTSKARGRTGRASVIVNVAGTSHAFNIATDAGSLTWTREQFSFQATGASTTLTFITLDDDAESFVNLDDVRVEGGCCNNPGLKITPSVTLEWECGVLQSAPTIAGPYEDVPGATSPFTAPATGGQKFWKTR